MYRKYTYMWRSKRYKRFLCRMPFFFNVTYGIDRQISIDSLRKHVQWYEELCCNKGPEQAVLLFKRVRDSCVRFAANQQFERLDCFKLHDDGLPLRVGHLMQFLKSKDINHRRFAIHVLDIVKLCEIQGPDPSTESITTPLPELSNISGNYIGETIQILGKTVTDKATLCNVTETFRKVLKQMFPPNLKDERLSQVSRLSDIHMSVRKGPNGPALGTIEEDYLGVQSSGIINQIRWIAEATNNSGLLIAIDEAERDFSNNPGFTKVGETYFDSRLAIKAEPWCKTRFFAICDWFSQSALKGLHKWIFSWLRSQKEDGTMSQDLVADIVRGWTNLKAAACQPSEGVYSLDLSKATDRLPATIQREILAHIFGKEFADNWYTICTNRLFKNPIGPSVRFAVGQPLGVYSSWAMLALTHHVICRTALKLSGRQREKEKPAYVVIGDDVAMVGSKQMKWYSLIMKSILRVSISPIKGFTPDTCIGSNPLNDEGQSVSAEIAKRIFLEGVELSVVSPETLLSAMEYPADFPNLLFQLSNRGCNLELSTPVSQMALAMAGYNPDIACIFATFPLRAVVSKETVALASEKYPNLLDFVPWFQTEVPINGTELESMFRKSIRDGLQSILDKYVSQYDVYIKLGSEPKEKDQEVYHFKCRTVIITALLNKAMLYMVDLINETEALNFQGPGQKLDEIASAINTMIDFEISLKGKPSGKRENLHRMRSRVITKLQPFAQQAVRKAKEYFGILLIDSGHQVNLGDEIKQKIFNRMSAISDMLSSDRCKQLYEAYLAKMVDDVQRRTLEFVT